MRRLRIGIVAHAELGGSGTVATDLAVGLVARGHEVHMITPRRPFRLAESRGVQVHEVVATPHVMWDSPPWTLALASRIVQVAREAELDVLHAHFAVPYAAATELACRILGAAAPAWIATLHGSDVDPLGTDAAYGPVVRHVLAQAGRVTVVSRNLLERAQALLPAVPIEIVPNFVDGQRFRPPNKRPPPSQGAVLIHASNFRAVKRVHDVVGIFHRVAQQIPARLLLVGDGPERDAALSELVALGLRDRVEAPGAQTNVEDWLARAHVALLPSEQESFGLAALEAQAAGVPVVATHVGGLPEVVIDGHTGHLAAVGDLDRMASDALALLADDEQHQRFAQAAREHALTHFAQEQALLAYEALYLRALDERDSADDS